ncbi:MAG: OmpA family protein [Candidatus Acidiferrales bacterium]
MRAWLISIMLGLLAATSAWAHEQPRPAQQNQSSFEVTMVARTITVINYEHRGSATQIGFQGSPIMPNGKGSGKVESKQGRIQINAEFQKFTPPQLFGPEYLTFVLWAITPEGKSNNLGEILLDGDRSKISVTTSLQTFGLIVTAEPYFAVSQPSNAVVLENIVVVGTSGTIEQATAKYQSLDKGVYKYDFSSASSRYPRSKSKTPLELDEARNAIEIAKTANAPQYAPEAFGRAQASLSTAESLFASKGDRKRVIQAARDAVQNAADARTTAVTRENDEKVAREKAAAAAAEAKAKAEAEAAQHAQQQAEIQKLQAERDAAQAAQARAEAEAAQHAAQLQAQQDQLKAQEAQQKAELERLNAEQQRQKALEAEAAAAKAEKEKEQLRAQLLDQFNRILPTTDTPRGLKVNMADVLFDFGKFDLKASAREALAKMSGIVIAHPGLKLAVEGYTDSVGSDAFNLTLSQNRADAVRAYLVNQGLDPLTITATGYGKSGPVATNDTSAGRQQNRRVEIIISGELIGEKFGAPPATQRQ